MATSGVGVGAAWAAPRPRLRERRPRSRWRQQRRLLSLAVLSLVVLFGFLMPVAWGAPAGAMGTVTVRQGSTLWSIAVERYPGLDPRVVVADLERANRLRGVVIQPGVRLVLPAI